MPKSGLPPQLSLAKGLSQDQVVAAVIKGYQKAHQETGIIGNFILCCMRGKDNHDLNLETVKVAKRFLGKGVVAIDLAGAEALFKTNTFNQEFELAKALGVPFTIHAGEADGPSVWDASILARAESAMGSMRSKILSSSLISPNIRSP
jgi:adenosine deaminase